jgi:hypothetical protein
MEYGIGENEHAFDEFYEYATENLLPAIASDIAQVGHKGAKETGMSIIGNLGVIGVAGYLGANRDFLGNPIVSSGLANLEPKDQYTNRTSKIAYHLGQAFNASPVEIDYFFQQVLGGWWKYQKALFPVGGENVDYTLGVQNTYIKDNQYSTDLVNWLYDKAEASKKAKNSDKSDMDKAIVAKMDATMTSFYSEYYSVAKNESETNLTRSVRQVVMDMIREYQKAADSGATTEAQDIVYDLCKDLRTTEYLPSAMPSVIKDGNKKEHTLSGTQYVEYQTEYLRLYWETVEDSLSGVKTTKEKEAILAAAKSAAKEEATNRVLARIGATKLDSADKYKGISTSDLATYKGKVSYAGEDGSVSRSEVVDIISGMGVANDDAWTLYISKYDSKESVSARNSGINASLYMKAKVEMENIKPTYRNGKEVEGSRRAKVEAYLKKVCKTNKEYLFLLGTEYPSVKNTSSYIRYFGKE